MVGGEEAGLPLGCTAAKHARLDELQSYHKLELSWSLGIDLF
jgi:hypothetical protein